MTETDETESRGRENVAGGGGERESGESSPGPGSGSGVPGESAGAERKAKRRSGRRRRKRSGQESSAGTAPAVSSRGPRRGRGGRKDGSRPETRSRPRRDLLSTSLLVMALLGLAVAAFFIFLPFLSTLIAAVLITTVAHPLFARVLSLVGSRRRGLASGITCILVILLVVLPALLCGWRVAYEVGNYLNPVAGVPSDETSADGVPADEASREGVPEDGGERVEAEWWELLLAEGTAEVQRQIAQLRRDLGALSSAPEASEPDTPGADPVEKPAFSISAGSIANVARWVTRVLGSLLAGVVGVVVKCLLMLFIMFYFFKDGPRILRSVQHALAVDPAYQERVIEKFKVVTVGMLKGILATASLQGVVAGIAFVFLGLPAFLFGSLVALCALVPIAGTGLVTVPLTVYYLVNGYNGHDGQYWRAAAAAVIGVLIASLDNIVRPLLIEGDLQLHPVWILLSILGGVGCFGALGLILGPMVVVLLRTVLALVAEESQRRSLEKA